MIKILYQGDRREFQALRNTFNTEKTQIENRSLDNMDPGSAGILTDYDILAFDLVSPIYIHPNYGQKILNFLNNKRGILIFILRQHAKQDHSPPQQKSIEIYNHELLAFLLLNAGYENDRFKFQPNPSYKLIISPHGKNSAIRQ